MSTQNQATTRPLTIRHGAVEYSVLISAKLWGYAEQLKEGFSVGEDVKNITEIELAASFLKMTISRTKKEPNYLDLLKVLLHSFSEQFVKSNNVHAITRSLSSSLRRDFLETFYAAQALFQNRTVTPIRESSLTHSALFQAAKRGDAKLFAVFGGQGNIDDYFTELSEVWKTYKCLVNSFILRIAGTLSKYSCHPEAKALLSKGLDILRWLEDENARPDAQYLISALVSLPLIGLTQLLHYYVTIRVLGCSPAEICSLFEGTTGHSQGIISSVAIFSSSTEEEFLDNGMILFQKVNLIYSPSGPRMVSLQTNISSCCKLVHIY